MPPSIPEFSIRPEALPPALRELVRVLGHADAFRLIVAHGGGRVNVPKRPAPDHPLRMALSAEGFAKLVAWAPGELLNLPKGDAYMRELRHHQVREARADGMTVDETAAATGYSRRHVINIIGGDGVGRDNRTLDMFDEDSGEAKSPASPWSGLGDPFGGHSK